MKELHINIIGIVAGICTTMSFFPQLTKILKTKHVRDISLKMYIILSTGIFLWLIYGFLSESFPIILANTMSLTLCLIIVTKKISYDKKDS